ncbi:MAG: VOC family protein [Acidobacteria bacterium]|nr:VOC family protein [Acidobacteriota bacterium]
MSKILQNHYVLAVHDLELSSRFFMDLGFEVSSTPPGWIFLEKDNCMVMLGDCPDAAKPADLGDHSYFGYLRVDDVDSYYEDVKTRGVPISMPLASKPWAMREFGVASPEGHRIMIGQWIG